MYCLEHSISLLNLSIVPCILQYIGEFLWCIIKLILYWNNNVLLKKSKMRMPQYHDICEPRTWLFEQHENVNYYLVGTMHHIFCEKYLYFVLIQTVREPKLANKSSQSGSGYNIWLQNVCTCGCIWTDVLHII